MFWSTVLKSIAIETLITFLTDKLSAMMADTTQATKARKLRSLVQSLNAVTGRFLATIKPL